MRFLLSTASGVIICLTISACSSSGPTLVKATGKVMQNDKPYTVAKGGGVGLVFIPVLEQAGPTDTYPTRMNPDDSSFIVEGKEGRGIPAGKYRVSVQQMVPGAPAAIKEMNDRFGETNSPIFVQVIDAKTPLVIDLAKSKGKS